MACTGSFGCPWQPNCLREGFGPQVSQSRDDAFSLGDVLDRASSVKAEQISHSL